MVKINNVLWPLDVNYIDLNDKIILYLKSILYKYDAKLHVLYVVPEFTNHVSNYMADFNYNEICADMLNQAELHLEKFVKQNLKDIDGVRTYVQIGQPTQVILDYAAENHIDLIVMGTQGRSRFEEFILGSVSKQVIKKAKSPVLAINPHIKEQ
jgi:nucleotide-binding universal stress UspA family protein